MSSIIQNSFWVALFSLKVGTNDFIVIGENEISTIIYLKLTGEIVYYDFLYDNEP